MTRNELIDLHPIPDDCDVEFPCGLTPAQVMELDQQTIFTLAERDMALFSWWYFPDHIDIQYGVPDFHKESYMYIAQGHEFWRLHVVVEPRGFAKTTRYEFVYPLWCFGYRKKNFIVISTENDDLATDEISNIRKQIEENDLFIESFGNYRPQKGQDAYGKWSTRDLIFTDGRRLRGIGMGSRIRGRKTDKWRPDLIIVGDAESENNAANGIMMRKNMRWLNRAVRPAIDPQTGQVLVVGNMIEPNCMVHTLSTFKHWNPVVHSCIVSGDLYTGIPLWPKYWTLEKLRQKKMEYEAEGDYDSFEIEYMNNPMSKTSTVFRREDLRFWRGELLQGANGLYLRLFETGRPMASNPANILWTKEYDKLFPVKVFAGFDPAFTEKESSDYTAVSCVAIDSDGNRYIVGLMFIKLSSPFEQVKHTTDRLIETHTSEIRVETVAAQSLYMELFYAEFDKRGIQIDVIIADHEGIAKPERIKRLEPGHKAHKFYYQDEAVSEETRQMFTQLLNHPRAGHDDGPDSLEMATKNSIFVIEEDTVEMSVTEDIEEMMERARLHEVPVWKVT